MVVSIDSKKEIEVPFEDRGSVAYDLVDLDELTSLSSVSIHIGAVSRAKKGDACQLSRGQVIAVLNNK
jgi:hypothetical protein